MRDWRVVPIENYPSKLDHGDRASGVLFAIDYNGFSNLAPFASLCLVENAARRSYIPTTPSFRLRLALFLLVSLFNFFVDARIPNPFAKPREKKLHGAI